jgi:hypothetical protein
MNPLKYPVTYVVSDVVSIIANAPYNFTVEIKKFGFSKKLNKPVITKENRYASTLRQSIKIALNVTFDSDLMSILDRLDEIEAGINRIADGEVNATMPTNKPNSDSKQRKGEK